MLVPTSVISSPYNHGDSGAMTMLGTSVNMEKFRGFWIFMRCRNQVGSVCNKTCIFNYIIYTYLYSYLSLYIYV